LVTKGDSCSVHDAPVPPAAILGAVVGPVSIGWRLRAMAEFVRLVVRRVFR
jgi:hypothetical protein